MILEMDLENIFTVQKFVLSIKFIVWFMNLVPIFKTEESYRLQDFEWKPTFLAFLINYNFLREKNNLVSFSNILENIILLVNI